MYRRLVYLSALIALAMLLAVSQAAIAPTPISADELLQELGDIRDANIYFAETNGEASRFDRTENGVSRYAGLLSSLGANLFTLEWRKGIPADADLIIILGPTAEFDANQTARLWSYLNNGGRLLLIVEPPFGRDRSLLSQTSLFALTWLDWGINSRNDYIVTEDGTQIVEIQVEIPPEELEEPEETEQSDAENTEEGGEEQPAEPQFRTELVEAPILVSDFITGDVAEHPITDNLEGALAFSMARSLEIDASIQDVEVTPLIFAGPEFYGELRYGDYLQTGLSEYNTEEDTARGSIITAAAFENPNQGARMVLIGDRQFVTNGQGMMTSPSYSASFVYPDNARFLLQATFWLLNTEPVEIAFPTPGPTATPTTTPTATPDESETSSDS